MVCAVEPVQAIETPKSSRFTIEARCMTRRVGGAAK
jgi:hypothetical protein